MEWKIFSWAKTDNFWHTDKMTLCQCQSVSENWQKSGIQNKAIFKPVQPSKRSGASSFNLQIKIVCGAYTGHIRGYRGVIPLALSSPRQNLLFRAHSLAWKFYPKNSNFHKGGLVFPGVVPKAKKFSSIEN